jgi:hypothetical protein
MAAMASVSLASTPARAAHAVRVRDVAGRAQVAIEGLDAGKCERIVERRQFGGRKALRDIRKQRRRFGEDAVIGDQRGHARLRVDRKIFRLALVATLEAQPHGFKFGAGVDQRDMRGERAGMRRIKQLEHEFIPFCGAAASQ